jgi:hypothetical protein
MEHVGEEKINAYMFLVRKSEERDKLDDLGLDGGIIYEIYF